jgi:hypothetical protein
MGRRWSFIFLTMFRVGDGYTARIITHVAAQCNFVFRMTAIQHPYNDSSGLPMSNDALTMQCMPACRSPTS